MDEPIVLREREWMSSMKIGLRVFYSSGPKIFVNDSSSIATSDTRINFAFP